MRNAENTKGKAMKTNFALGVGLLSFGLLPVLTACNTDLNDLIDRFTDPDIARIEGRFGDRGSRLQQQDPRNLVLPNELANRGDTVVINNQVTVINNFQEDVVVVEVPDSVWLVFDNLTGDDIYVEYLADNAPQSVFVLDGDTLILEYPCLATIDLLSEEHFDVFTGASVDFFNLDVPLDRGPNFECGEALLFSFEPDGVFVEPDVIDLLD